MNIQQPPAEGQQLKKSLNPMNIWALALGAIIGFGCFILPPDFLEKSGPMGVFLGLAVGAAIMVVIGRNISFMVERFPVAGGQFSYAYLSFGKLHGYICGWMLSLCFVSLISMNATALGIIAEHLAPDLFIKGYLYTVAGWDVYLPQILLSLFFIVLFGVFNFRGGKIAGNLQLGMVGLMVAAVVLILVGTAVSPQASFQNLAPAFPEGVAPLAGILTMVAMSPWLYVGFDTIPHAAEEFNFSAKKTFRLVYASILAGGLIYLVVTLCTAMVWPWPEMVASRYAWATGAALQSSIGTAGVIFLSVAICMGIFTGMNGFYLASSRLLLSMSQERILPAWFGKVHPKHQTPANGVLVAMGISLIAPFFGRTAIGWVVDMCSCGTAIAYLYTSLAVWKEVRRQRREPGEKPSLALWVPIAGVVSSIVIMLLLIVPGSPGAMGKESWFVLLAWAALGVIFYLTSARKKHDAER